MAIERVLELYPALIKALNVLITTEKNFMGTVFKNELLSLKNLILLHSYADILSPLNSLTKQFQSKNIHYQEVQVSYQSYISALKYFPRGTLGIRTKSFITSLQKHNNSYVFKTVILKSEDSLKNDRLLDDKDQVDSRYNHCRFGKGDLLC